MTLDDARVRARDEDLWDERVRAEMDRLLAAGVTDRLVALRCAVATELQRRTLRRFPRTHAVARRVG